MYVADRANRRVQVFDENGKYCDEWYTRFPYYIHMSQDQHLWVGDGQTNKILKYDLTGKLLIRGARLARFPVACGDRTSSASTTRTTCTSRMCMSAASRNSAPKKGVDPARLVGRQAVVGAVAQVR